MFHYAIYIFRAHWREKKKSFEHQRNTYFFAMWLRGACECLMYGSIRCQPGHPGPWAMHHGAASPALVLNQQETVLSVPMSEIFVFIWKKQCISLVLSQPLGLEWRSLFFPMPIAVSGISSPSLLFTLPVDGNQQFVFSSIIFQQETTKGLILVSGFKDTC